MAQEDLPFSEKGVCPDLIMNPHGFPRHVPCSACCLGLPAMMFTGRMSQSYGRVPLSLLGRSL